MFRTIARTGALCAFMLMLGAGLGWGQEISLQPAAPTAPQVVLSPEAMALDLFLPDPRP